MIEKQFLFQYDIQVPKQLIILVSVLVGFSAGAFTTGNVQAGIYIGMSGLFSLLVGMKLVAPKAGKIAGKLGKENFMEMLVSPSEDEKALMVEAATNLARSLRVRLLWEMSKESGSEPKPVLELFQTVNTIMVSSMQAYWRMMRGKESGELMDYYQDLQGSVPELQRKDLTSSAKLEMLIATAEKAGRPIPEKTINSFRLLAMGADFFGFNLQSDSGPGRPALPGRQQKRRATTDSFYS